MTPTRWTVPSGSPPERLDVHVARVRDVPRNQVGRWIREGHVLVGGRPAKASRIVAAGEVIECLPPPRGGERDLAPEEGILDVLYEDRHVAVIAKPAGLAVHPGAGRSAGTLAHRLLARFPETREVGGPGRPGIVHRLDKDTTGALLVARTAAAYRTLAEAFAERRVGKRYLAVVYGVPRPPEGTLQHPIGRHPTRRKEMAVRPGGRPARTDYRCRATGGGIALLELDLATGRTHQARVHLKALGHPLVGDPVYGEARWRDVSAPTQRALREFPRPALHAWRLRLEHPIEGGILEVEAPVPTDLENLWRGVTGRPFPHFH